MRSKMKPAFLLEEPTAKSRPPARSLSSVSLTSRVTEAGDSSLSKLR